MLAIAYCVIYYISKSFDHIKNLHVVNDKAYCNSDHYPITFDITVKCKRRSLQKRSMYNYNRADWPNIISKLNDVAWESALDKLEPDIAWDSFKNILFGVLDKYVPKMKVKSEFKSPWFDSECLQKSKEKERLHKKFKDNRNLRNELKFKTCRREFKNLIKAKMRANLCENNRNQLTKKFWSQVKSTSKSTRVPETVFLKGKTSSESKTKADMFNKFFYNQFSNASNYDIDIDFNLDESFEIEFNVSKVKDILCNIDSNKAQGPDNIHGLVLKKCANALAKPLSLIFKLIYNTGVIPVEWKLANVVPVFKKGEKDNVENYRPISLTCICGKIMERIMYDELYSRTINLLDNRQHGFLRNKSCVTNMTTLVESISSTLTENLPTDIIYFDFAKAFDTVNHDLILSKLKFQYHIDGRMLKFFKNYLSNRSQRVVLDNCNSDIVSVLSGVPQGSIIGPLLFVLFINDIYQNVDEKSYINLYADDTKLWRKIASSADCDVLQKDIESLNQWCMINKMTFNESKCKVLTVTNSEPLFMNVLPFTKYPYTLGNVILDYTNCERDLGVFVNERFNWQDHHNYILKKAFQMMGLTKRTCHFIFDKGKKRSLYLALVRSNFEHCSNVWRPVNAVDTCKFESLQKQAIKWVNGEDARSYSDELYALRCKQADILPLQQHFDLNDLLFFHKIVYNIIPVSLPNYISPYNGVSRLRESHLDHMSFVMNDNTVIPLQKVHCNSKFFKSYFFRTLHIWNKLPLNIREISSHVKFKLKVKNFLWNQLMVDRSIHMGL